MALPEIVSTQPGECHNNQSCAPKQNLKMGLTAVNTNTILYCQTRATVNSIMVNSHRTGVWNKDCRHYAAHAMHTATQQLKVVNWEPLYVGPGPGPGPSPASCRRHKLHFQIICKIAFWKSCRKIWVRRRLADFVVVEVEVATTTTVATAVAFKLMLISIIFYSFASN